MSAGEIAAGVAIGLAAGGIAGLLGIGGGVVMVPAMVLLLERSQLVAQGTSLLVIIPTAVVSAVSYARHGMLDGRTAGWLSTGGVAGAALGAVLATQVVADDEVLRRIFGVFMIAVAVRLFFDRGRPEDP